MRIETLKYLACCRCHDKFNLENPRYYRGSICRGTLKCRECGLDYPVVMGRPVVMTAGMERTKGFKLKSSEHLQRRKKAS